MTHVICPKCQNPSVLVLQPGRYCVDCCLPTPAQRQRRFEEMERTIEQLQVSLRDKFAVAALPAVIAGDGFAHEAYAWADRMIEARGKATAAPG